MAANCRPSSAAISIGSKLAVGVELVEDDGDPTGIHTEAFQRGHEAGHVHEAGAIRGGDGEDVVDDVEDRHGEVAQAFVGVDHDPGAPGPQRLEDPRDVARR